MKSKSAYKWYTFLTTLLLMLFTISAFSKDRIYIRNRYNGGFFGYKYVQTSIYSDADNRDVFITNCTDPGIDRCRHQRQSNEPGGDIHEDLINSAFGTAELKSSEGEIGGRIKIEENWIAVWSIIETPDAGKFSKFTSIKIQFYTVQEALELGIY